MASKSDIEAGKAHIVVYVKNSPALKALQAIQKEAQAIGTSLIKVGGIITGVAAAITGPIGAAVNTFVGLGTELSTVSRRTGLGTRALGEFRHAAEQTGASLGDVEGASKSLTKAIADASMGGAGSVLAFSRLGTTAEALKKQLPEQQLQTIADRLAAIKDPAQQAALAAQVLGGTNLLPMVAQLGALRQEARDLGLAPSEQAVADAANLGRLIKRQLSAVTAAIFEIGAAVGPTLFPIGEALLRITGRVTRWIRENQQVVRTVARIGAIIAAVGVAVTGIGVAIFGVGTVFGAVATIATTVSGAIGGIITAVSALGVLIGPLLSPLGLILLAVGAIGTALAVSLARWTKFTDTAKAALGEVVRVIQPYVDVVRTTIGGIVDALMSGQIGAAARIAILGMRVAFEMGRLAIVGGWLDLRNRVLVIWDEIGVRIAGVLAYVGKLWSVALTGMLQTDIGKALSQGWEGFQIAATTALKNVIAYAHGLAKAVNIILKQVQSTIQVVAVTLPTLEKLALGNAANQIKDVAGPDIVAAMNEAAAAADEAMQNARADRAERRREREQEADIWRNAQLAVINANRRELEERAAEARALRDRLRAGGAGDVRPGDQRAVGDVVSGAALRQNFGTFSGLALALGGAGESVTRRQLRVAEEQRNLQRDQLRAADRNVQAAERLEQALRMA
jgi:hypothetical protein